MLPGQHCSQQPGGLSQKLGWSHGLGLSLPGTPNPRPFIPAVVLMGSGAPWFQMLSQDRNPAVQLEGMESEITLELPVPEKVGRPFVSDVKST